MPTPEEMQKEIDDLKNSSVEKDGKISNLSTELSTSKSSVSDLSFTVSNKEAAIKVLEASVEELQGVKDTNSENETKLSVADSNFESLKEKYVGVMKDKLRAKGLEEEDLNVDMSQLEVMEVLASKLQKKKPETDPNDIPVGGGLSNNGITSASNNFSGGSTTKSQMLENAKSELEAYRRPQGRT